MTLLVSLLLLLLATVSAAQESLVISTIVSNDINSFLVLELTACSNIADLSKYTFEQFGVGSASPYYVYNGDSLKRIPKGSRLYVTVGLNTASFLSFFGFAPTYLLATAQLALGTGSFTMQLIYNSTTIVDAYGIAGADNRGATIDFTNGWTGRTSGRPTFDEFNIADWSIHPSAFALNPLVSSNATPPVEIGTYQCNNTVPPPAANESLVISTIVSEDTNGFFLLELTACSTIADLSKYTFEQYSGASESPLYAYNGDSLKQISKGTRLYVTNGLTAASFLEFFGFSPAFILLTPQLSAVTGSYNMQLVYNSTTTVDVYGVVGVDHTSTTLDYTNGWTGRTSGTQALTDFKIADWTSHRDTFALNPSSNLNATTPIQLGTYQCPDLTSEPPPPVIKESLVISTMVSYDYSFVLWELTACSDIADLSRYTFEQYYRDELTPFYVYQGYNLKHIPAGSRIYIGSVSASFIEAFFGFTPTFVLYAAQPGLYIGGYNFRLVKNNSTVVDAYGDVGVDNFGKVQDFVKGWTRRKSYDEATIEFNLADWNVYTSAFAANPPTNSGAQPPVELGTYKCSNNATAPPVPVPVVKESLVISTVVSDDYYPFALLELTACSTIADLSKYTFEEYAGAATSPTFVYQGDSLKRISKGTRLYITNGLSSASFRTFFNFTPTFVLLTPQLSSGTGSYNLQLVYNSTTTVDTYGVVGVDHTSTTLDYTNGWTGRTSGTQALTDFKIADWTSHRDTFALNPSSNLNATTPIQLGTYQCPNTTESPTPPPSPLTEESLVISTIVSDDYYAFVLLELTACSDIADLSKYTFEQYYRGDVTPTYVYQGYNLKHIPAGSRIYIGSVSASFIEAFFGFTPTFVLYAAQPSQYIGGYNFHLVSNSTIVDAYGDVGVDNFGKVQDFVKGWTQRKSYNEATPEFNLADWSIHTSAFAANPPTNSGGQPPVEFGTYQCPNKTMVPTLSPTTHSTSTVFPSRNPANPSTASPTQKPTNQVPPSRNPAYPSTVAPSQRPIDQSTPSLTGKPTDQPTQLPTPKPAKPPTPPPNQKPNRPRPHPTRNPQNPTTLPPTRTLTTNQPTPFPTRDLTVPSTLLPTTKPSKNNPTSSPTITTFTNPNSFFPTQKPIEKPPSPTPPPNRMPSSRRKPALWPNPSPTRRPQTRPPTPSPTNTLKGKAICKRRKKLVFTRPPKQQVGKGATTAALNVG